MDIVVHIVWGSVAFAAMIGGFVWGSHHQDRFWRGAGDRKEVMESKGHHYNVSRTDEEA